MLDLFRKLMLKITKGKSDSLSIRDIRLYLSIFTAGLDKVIGIGATLITMPITLEYLGVTQFGIWMVISGFVTFLSFSDLGIGMGLQNALSKAYGENDKESPKYLISSAYFIVSFLVFTISILIFFLGNVLSTADVFSLDSGEDLEAATQSLYYCLIVFMVGVPITLIQRVLNGFQKTYIANNILLFGKILALSSIFLTVRLDLGLIGLTTLYIASPLFSMLCYSLYFFSRNFDLIPKVSRVKREFINSIMGSGLWTVFVQIIYIVKMNMPVVIVSTVIGVSAAAEYSVAQKLIGVGGMVISMAMQPLWTVYGEAYYNGDRSWVEKTLIKSLKMVMLLTILGSIAFISMGQWLIHLWLGDDVMPSLLLIVGFSLWMIASSINICFAMVLNGTGNFRNQSLFSVVLVSAALLISYYLIPSHGLASVIFVLFLVAELCRIPLFFFETKRVISKI